MQKRYGDSEIQAVHLGKWVNDDQNMAGWLPETS
jgi:hypothetical protein